MNEQQKLREAVARALCSADAKKHGTVESVWKIYLPDADAAIAVALKEAARVAGTHHKGGCNCLYCYGREDAQDAIRALIPSAADPSDA